ncbi:phage virion morphogenesis protein [Trichormus variabilis]|uniref:Virion morphogenesis protein n=1 Tax=Trichormus variabilis SAG 1403-4b TaxID=447716 RepID=A0A3S1BVL1_ANAVA|nr:phage virion morphogenesis protein [Trichormus variabilis]MBD2628478.1 phage virion morphogenesis protein [Trichormus variabilis FACHB-164]RUS92518.1 virion morphogenesis protein [Trichormus variabilis SAG 1403-4b]
MAGVTLRIDDSQVQAALSRLTGRMENLTPVFKNIGEYMTSSILERFDDEVDFEGNKWAALTAATIARKQKKGKILKILQQDGDLRRTVVYLAGANKVEIGTNRIYGAIHQFGGRAGRGRKVVIRARPFLGVSAADSLEVVSIVEEFLVG